MSCLKALELLEEHIEDALEAADDLIDSREKSLVKTKLDEARLWADELRRVTFGDGARKA